MKKNFGTKITNIFFCLFFSLIFSCAGNTPPQPDQDPFYQALISNSSNPDIGRPPSAPQIISQDSPSPSSSSTEAASIQGQRPSYMPPELLQATNQNNLIAPISPYPASTQPSFTAPTPQIAGAPTAINPTLNYQPPSAPNQASNAPPAPYINPYFNALTAPLPAPPQEPLNLLPQDQLTLIAPETEPDFDFSEVGCNISENGIKEILAEVKKKKNNVIKTLPACLKLNRSLMMRAAIIDPPEFEYAADILKEDESFVHRMLEINPEILKFAAASLRSDPDFMEEATYLNRDALQYASQKLLDNKLFIRNMINIDAKNYMFASDRLKALPEFAANAFKDNGMLLQYAPTKIKSDKKLVTLAVKSNSDALQYASDEIKEDKALKKLAVNKSSIKSDDELRKFLRENYVNDSDKKNLGLILDNRLKYFADNKIVDRNYITKWQRNFDINNENLRLIAADSRNFPVSWKDDFKRFPLLIKKIEKFLSNHKIDQSTIDSLSTVYFWKVKKNPQTVLFNLYLLRDSKDIELGPKFSNVTSLTAIAQKHGENWNLSVVEVIFDSELKIDLAFDNGHKKYVLWDLYETNKKDKNPKIIFKVEDSFREYFEIFEEQNNGKYHMTYQIDSIKDAMEEAANSRKSLTDETSF